MAKVRGVFGFWVWMGVLLAPVAAAGGPVDVAERFYEAVGADRVEEALELVHPGDRPAVAELLKDVRHAIQTELGGLRHVQVELLELDGDHAEVEVHVVWEAGGAATVPHALLREAGEWLLRAPRGGEEAAPEPPGPPGPPGPLHLVHRQAVNPYNVIHVPRPNPDAEHVPLHTSFFLIIGTDHPDERVDPDTLSITLQPENADAHPVLEAGQGFAEGYSGELFHQNDNRYGPGLAVYVESETALEPATRYHIAVTAESVRGKGLPEGENAWSFTTESAAQTHALSHRMDLAAGPDVHWEGAFFNALAKPAFTTSSRSRLPHYDLIAEAQKTFPEAWNLQRDAYLAGFEHQPQLMKYFPNIVREKETRRIAAITREDGEAWLHVEDFFGHEQYGIPSGRPVSADYHAGDEVLIADGVSSARAHVLSADDELGVVRVTDFEDPPGGWKIDYTRPLPVEEDPNAPGLFPPGGAYLRKFDPVGTPHYYWCRVNHEWDIVHGEYGRRVIPRFASAIGCTAIDGASGTTAKDLAQHHEVTREITSHLIARYGDATLEWPWVILNEPDLTSLYWRNEDWEELQRFYDYTADAILRAFEDHGYDSEQVRVGGLELGAIWGDRHLRLDDFLYHCSPNVDSEDALTLNAAYADPRLDGKRSARVERLCAENDGMGAPLDFLSVHSYDASDIAAAKLIRSKERALEIDPKYYAALPIVSHETVPTWRRIIDPGAAGIYLGNGYFTSWMADFQARLLQQGARDPRHAHGGELILMHWPGIVKNFNSLNDTVREIRLADRSEVIAKPSFHFMNLLSTMEGGYWVLTLEEIDGHAVSGFAARTNDDLRLVIYAHHHEDTASDAQAEFELVIELAGLEWEHVQVEEHRFDKHHNSYHHLARKHRQYPEAGRSRIFSEEEFEEIAEQASLRVTGTSAHAVESGTLQLSLTISANGANFAILTPDPH